MIKIDPIIAVKDVETSSKWYQQVFGFKRIHGEMEMFAVLVSENDEILFCLHQWEEHHHPTMTNPSIPSGNGLILYFRTENMNAILSIPMMVTPRTDDGIPLLEEPINQRAFVRIMKIQFGFLFTLF